MSVHPEYRSRQPSVLSAVSIVLVLLGGLGVLGPTGTRAVDTTVSGDLDRVFDPAQHYEAGQRVIIDVGGFDLGDIMINVSRADRGELSILSPSDGHTSMSGDGGFVYSGGSIPLQLRYDRDSGILAYMVTSVDIGTIELTVSGKQDGHDRVFNANIMVAALTFSSVTTSLDYDDLTGMRTISSLGVFAFGFIGNVSISLRDPGGTEVGSDVLISNGSFARGVLELGSGISAGLYTLEVRGNRLVGDSSSVISRVQIGNPEAHTDDSMGLFSVGGLVVSLEMVQIVLMVLLIITIIAMAAFLFYRMKSKEEKLERDIKAFVGRHPGCDLGAISGDLMCEPERIERSIRKMLDGGELFSTTGRRGERFHAERSGRASVRGRRTG